MRSLVQLGLDLLNSVSKSYPYRSLTVGVAFSLPGSKTKAGANGCDLGLNARIICYKCTLIESRGLFVDTHARTFVLLRKRPIPSAGIRIVHYAASLFSLAA